MDEVKTLNLLRDSWLPVKDNHGNKTSIKISDLGGEKSKGLIEILAPRADFKGAIYQLLIGILQTAFAPKDSREWKKYWCNPPSKDGLEQAFKSIEPAFNLNTENGVPAFMQDFDLPYEKKDVSIGEILIEAPGENTVKQNIDHFIKRYSVNGISSYWAAVALFTLQINAAGGGQGYRVSLRGGGPLTTLVLPPEKSTKNSLWHQLWLNVLTSEEMFEVNGNHALQELSAIFPWMMATRVSTSKKVNKKDVYIKDGTATFPIDVNPLQAYWSMPRRMRLHWNNDSGVCDISGEHVEHLVHQFHRKNFGVNYSGNWVHPLTPYAFEADQEPLSLKGQPGGLGYRHWLGLAVLDSSGKIKKEPALIVKTYSKSRHQWIEDTNFTPRLWAFAYDMNNDKARCWYETTMPLFNLETDALDSLQDYAQKMIMAAVDVLKTLKSALKSAWFKRPKDAKGDISFIDANFWSSSETEFYRLLAQLAELAKKEDDAAAIPILTGWRYYLKQVAHQIFEQYALNSMNEDGDFKRVIKAKHDKGGLEHYLNASKTLKALTA